MSSNHNVNLTANQVDVAEDLRVFIGNFERQDSSGNWVAVDSSDIGGISGFRPSVFATYSNNFFMFSSLGSKSGHSNFNIKPQLAVRVTTL